MDYWINSLKTIKLGVDAIAGWVGYALVRWEWRYEVCGAPTLLASFQALSVLDVSCPKSGSGFLFFNFLCLFLSADILSGTSTLSSYSFDCKQAIAFFKVRRRSKILHSCQSYPDIYTITRTFLVMSTHSKLKEITLTSTSIPTIWTEGSMAPGVNWQNVLTPEDLSATGGEVKRANACNGCRKARSKVSCPTTMTNQMVTDIFCLKQCIRQGSSTTSTQSCARCIHLNIACRFNSVSGASH